jgi:hypothetical protein
MIGVREMTTRAAKTPSKMTPTTLPGMAVPSVHFDRGWPSLTMVVGGVEAHVKLALTLSADPYWAVQMREAVVTRSRQQVRRRLLRELDHLGGQLPRPEPKSLSAALTNLAKMHET